MSQSDAVTVKVGDHTYQCFKLDPWTMNEITHKILNTFGSTAGEFILALLSGKSDGKVEQIKKVAAQAVAEAGDSENQASLASILEKGLNPEHLAKGVSEALTNLDAAESRWLMEKLAEQTTIENGGKLSTEWATHFLGRPLDMYRWALAALRSQYGFLG